MYIDLKKARRQKPAHRSDAGKLDRLPPNSPEAEQGVLGCILLSPNDCLGDCVEKLKDDGKEAFYDLRHQTIYETLTLMFNSRAPIDLITVQQNLKDRQLLEQVGGIAYLAQLQDAVPSAANLAYYLEIVREKFLLRRMIQTCSGVVGKIYDYEGEVDALLDEVEKEVLSVNRSRSYVKGHTIKEFVLEALEDIERQFNNRGAITGISTGLLDLDKITDGLHPGEMTVIAAFPSVGKTSLALNIAEHVALELGLPVGVFSGEMNGRSLVKRAICSQAKISMKNVRDGFITESDFPRVNQAAGRLAASRLVIDQTSDMLIQSVRAKARRMVQEHGIKLFIADYIQLFSSKNAENRTNEIDQASKGFKQIAMEFQVPVIVLSQLNDDGKLKGARAIGEDADNYWELKRIDQGSTEESEYIQLWINKQRNGARGEKIDLTFLKSFTRFESRSIISQDDMPYQPSKD